MPSGRAIQVDIGYELHSISTDCCEYQDEILTIPLYFDDICLALGD